LGEERRRRRRRVGCDSELQYRAERRGLRVKFEEGEKERGLGDGGGGGGWEAGMEVG
jgi:hypothetical protein